MRWFPRGAWVRHGPSGRLGRVEFEGEALLSVAPWPPDNGGWLTARAEDFLPLRRSEAVPAPQNPPPCSGVPE